MSDVILRVDADTRQAEAKIGRLSNKSINLNTKNFNQPLGKITGQLGEFEKSLEASNARVIAFGASAGAIYAIQSALAQTVRSAIDVEKSLTDINVILNLSSESLSKFGASLFDIAKNTGNTFKTVADAATELSRQGLGVEETLKRTQNALILTRLSGLGAVDAVEALTATINGFSKEALNSSEIVNKFAAVDAAFAVSSADLAEAIKRVGSSASDAGVSLDQLIAIVTTAQQITARGGAVIGNSFKTIFTRLQRTDTLDALEGIGIATRDAQGNFLPLINVLEQLARTYDGLSAAQKASIAETVGGVFQINILKAALSDLGKEYSIYGRALQISNTATDEAVSRNEQLNKTFSSLLNKTLANLTQAGAKIGGEAFQPGIEKILTSLNSFLEDFSTKDTESFGAKIAQGLVTGIGSFLSGPGLLLAGKALFVIFERLAVFSADALKTILGLNARAAEQAQIQRQIFDLLSKNPQIIAQINQGSLTVEQTQSLILRTIQQQTAAMQQQIGLAKTLASSLSQAGVSIARTGINRGQIQAKYAGYIPNFANQDQLIENIGAAQHGYKAGKAYRKTLYDGYGGSFPAVVNSAETVKTFKNSIGKRATIVEPPNGFASGYIPNFAKTRAPKISRGKTADIMTYSDAVSMIFPKKAGLGRAVGFGESMGKSIGVQFPIAGFNPKLAIKPEDSILEKRLGNSLVNFTNDFIEKIFMSTQGEPLPGKLTSPEQLSNAGSFKSIVGTVFETAVDFATRETQADRKQNASIDFMSPSSKLKLLFNNAPGMYEAKNNALPANLDKTAQKIIDNGYLPENVKNQLGEKYKEESKARRIAEQVKAGMRKKPGANKYSGFIPNFSALNDAVQREKNAGINPSLIRIGSTPQLMSESNPLGLGVYNTRDEPTGLKQGVARNRSKGYIPSFAKADIGLSVEEKQRARAARSGPAKSMVSPGLELALAKNSQATSGALFKLKKTVEPAINATAQYGKAAFTSTPKMQQFTGKLAAAGIGASLIAGQLREFGGDNALANFGASAAEGAATFSTVAAIIPGPVGIAAGAFLGIGQLVNSISEGLENSVENKLIKNAEMSAENLSKFSESGQRYITAFENVANAIESGDPRIIQRAQEQLAATLLDVDAKYREELASAKSVAEVQEIYAKGLAEKSQEARGTKTAGELSTLMKSNRRNYFEQFFNETEPSKIGIFTGQQTAGRGGELAGRFAGQIVGGLDKKFFEDMQNGLIDTNLKGEDFIKMLSQYGLSVAETTALTELNNDSNHAGAENLEILRKAILDAGSTAIKASQNIDKLSQQTAALAPSINDVINEALAFTRQRNEQELGIERTKRLTEIYKPYMTDEQSAIMESGARVAEIELEQQEKLNELRQKYAKEFEEAEAGRATLNKQILIEQAKINETTKQSLALEKEKLAIQLKQLENERLMQAGGGVGSLTDPSGMISAMASIEKSSKQIDRTNNPVLRGILQSKRLSAMQSMGVDISGEEFMGAKQEMVKGQTYALRGLFGRMGKTARTEGEQQAIQRNYDRAGESAALQVASLTKDFSLVRGGAEAFNTSLGGAEASVNRFSKALDEAAKAVGANTGATINQGEQTASTANKDQTEKNIETVSVQEVKGNIDVGLSPLVVRVEGNVEASLDPVNQNIINALRNTVSQLEQKVNAMGLLQSKIGPPSPSV